MSLYPTIEDKTVAEMASAQVALENAIVHGEEAPIGAVITQPAPEGTTVSFMGEDVTYSSETAEGPVLPAYSGYTGYTPYTPQTQITTRDNGTVAVAQDRGLVNYKKAQIHEGVRTISIVPDVNGKLGLKVKSVRKGIFVQAVLKDLPAAAAGLWFGDQILEVNSQVVAGYDSTKANNLLKEGVKSGRVDLSVRERPFERTIVLKKSHNNSLGFDFKDGVITGIRKDSSAARNGLLTHHTLTEVNGQNTVHMKDKHITTIIEEGGESVTLTIVPNPMFKIMCKNLGSTPLKLMDHSVPEL